MKHHKHNSKLRSDEFDYRVRVLAEANTLFRKVLYTGESSQIVVMSLPPGSEMGLEANLHTDLILVPVSGRVDLSMDSHSRTINPRDVVLVPPGVVHNLKNSTVDDAKLVAIYAPPVYSDGTIHRTQTEAHAAANEALAHAWEQ